MKNVYGILSFLLIISLCIYSFYSLVPHYDENENIPATEFSVDRALTPLEEIAKAPHYVGSPAHTEVRKFLIAELRKLGLEPHIQKGYSLNPVSKTLNKPVNIVARIKGAKEGKALLLLSHYDSALVGSYGASDDGVGLVTILESIRAFLARGKMPENDIIVLFSDAEELGLDGAKLFVEEHPWAKNIGLVLNFEARGTAGASNMILETNGGNSELIKAFIHANPEYPVASSLMYSVYKLLPNDTDSTVFRELADIDSFFFAFIDDHFNYHTANDSMYFLDWNSLMHQGSYLLPLLSHFADADLSNLKSETDDVYFNFPGLKMVHYPFSWIFPLLILAWLLFIALVIFGIKNKALYGTAIGNGFLSLLFTLVICGLLGYFGWKFILLLYPKYLEIQQGFTYNGYWYILVFVFLSLAVCFSIYGRSIKEDYRISLYVAPLAFWLLINTLLAIFLKGAAFFIVPVFFGLISFFLLLKKSPPNVLILSFLAAPAIFIFVPLLQAFPVGLGLKMLVIATIFTALIFGLLLPVFNYYKFKKIISLGSFLLAVSFFVVAHTKSHFSVERKKPNSLVFFEDKDANKAYWLTYDRKPDAWTSKYLGNKPEKASKYLDDTAYSKYGINYSFASETKGVKTPDFEILLHRDTVVDHYRSVEFTIVPHRMVNKIDLYSVEKTDFLSLEFNGKAAVVEDSLATYRGTKNEALINYVVSNNEPLHVRLTVSKNAPLSFKVLEYSFDLLSNPALEVAPREEYMMPKPFIITDAIAVKRTFSVDSLKLMENKQETAVE